MTQVKQQLKYCVILKLDVISLIATVNPQLELHFEFLNYLFDKIIYLEVFSRFCLAQAFA
jgi:hypothetical protein